MWLDEEEGEEEEEKFNEWEVSSFSLNLEFIKFNS